MVALNQQLPSSVAIRGERGSYNELQRRLEHHRECSNPG